MTALQLTKDYATMLGLGQGKMEGGTQLEGVGK